jgi:hypothetical protein
VFRQHGKFADYLCGHTVKVGISHARACLGIFTREGQQLMDEMDCAIHSILQFAQQVFIAQLRVAPSCKLNLELQRRQRSSQFVCSVRNEDTLGLQRPVETRQ